MDVAPVWRRHSVPSALPVRVHRSARHRWKSGDVQHGLWLAMNGKVTLICDVIEPSVATFKVHRVTLSSPGMELIEGWGFTEMFMQDCVLVHV